jgi:hypothetical protein
MSAESLPARRTLMGCRAFPRSARYFLADLAVLTPEKQQRISRADHYVLDLGDKDGVIASFLRRLQTAFEIRQRAVQDRSSLRSAIEARPSFPFSVLVYVNRPRIVFRNHALVLG